MQQGRFDMLGVRGDGIVPGQPMKKGAVESSLAGSCILFCFVFPLKQILSCLNGVDEFI